MLTHCEMTARSTILCYKVMMTISHAIISSFSVIIQWTYWLGKTEVDAIYNWIMPLLIWFDRLPSPPGIRHCCRLTVVRVAFLRPWLSSLLHQENKINIGQVHMISWLHYAGVIYTAVCIEINKYMYISLVVFHPVNYKVLQSSLFWILSGCPSLSLLCHFLLGLQASSVHRFFLIFMFIKIFALIKKYFPISLRKWHWCPSPCRW